MKIRIETTDVPFNCLYERTKRVCFHNQSNFMKSLQALPASSHKIIFINTIFYQGEDSEGKVILLQLFFMLGTACFVKKT